MKDVGYGEGYEYAPDLEEGVADLQCLPDVLRGVRYYRPGRQGFEKTQGERMAYWEKRRERARRARGGRDPSETPEES